MPTIQVEGLGNVQFPEGTSEEDMLRSVQDALTQKNAPAPLSGPVGATPPSDPISGNHQLMNQASLWEGLKGAAKGALGTAQGLGDLITPKGSFWDTGHAMNTTASNPDQVAGKIGEGALELAAPVGEVVDALPSAKRAAGVLGHVADAAKNVRVPLSQALEPLERVTQLGERGGTLPTSANALLKRSQMLGDMTFPEARDYYSNISSLSGDEAGKLNGVMKRAVGGLRAGFHGDLTSAANQVGLGNEYARAMKEYGNAMRLRDLGKTALTKALPAGLVGGGVLGAIGYAQHKLKDLF